MQAPDQNAFNAEVQRRVSQWQAETLFPYEVLPENFPAMVSACFRFNSAFDLRMTADYYKQLTEKTEGYTYLDISQIGLVCKKRNAHELNMTMEQFNEFQMGVENMVIEMIRRSNEQQESISKKVVAIAKSEKTVPESHKTMKFPVTGQA